MAKVDVVVAVNEVVATASSASTPSSSLCNRGIAGVVAHGGGSPHPSARTIEGGRRQGQGGN